MVFPLVSLLFQEVEYDRASLIPFSSFEESFYFVVSFLEYMKCETNSLSYSSRTSA